MIYAECPPRFMRCARIGVERIPGPQGRFTAKATDSGRMPRAIGMPVPRRAREAGREGPVGRLGAALPVARLRRRALRRRGGEGARGLRRPAAPRAGRGPGCRAAAGPSRRAAPFWPIWPPTEGAEGRNGAGAVREGLRRKGPSDWPDGARALPRGASDPGRRPAPAPVFHARGRPRAARASRGPAPPVVETPPQGWAARVHR